MNEAFRPPFRIDCLWEEGPITDYEEACGEWRTGDKKLYLSIKTDAGSWRCIVTRSEMQELFDAIKRRGVTITFDKRDRQQA